jgi:4-hydroxybenzoate polyprenyltransferase
MRKYFSLVKFSHTIFALPFALIGFSLAVFYERQTFHWYLLLLMLLCMVFARSAAMGFNRYLDRKYDALNPRTAKRDIPTGLIKPKHALAFTIVNCILFIASCYFINDICLYLSPIALFVILFYSYTKRFTALCHLVLGVGLALAPIGAYLVVTGYFNRLPILFSLAVFTWVSGFDIIYALQDLEFDKIHKLHSIPVLFGKKGAIWISNILHFCSALFVIAAGILGEFSFLYWMGVALYAGLLVYQHRLVRPDDLSKVDMMFMTTNGIASLVFAVFTILDLVV